MNPTRKGLGLEADPHPAVRPSLVHEGLAVYAFGSGDPVLLMPYPHAAAVAGDRTVAELAEGLNSLERRVVTFDPPGSGRSTRPMRLDMPEMIECAEEALGVCGVRGLVDVMGHSQGSFAALAFAVERPERVRRLVLVGAGAGGPSWMRAEGAIWNRSHPDYRRFGLLSSLYFLSRRLAAQKLMYNLIFRDSYVDRSRFVLKPVFLIDWLRTAHPRTRWALVAVSSTTAPVSERSAPRPFSWWGDTIPRCHRLVPRNWPGRSPTPGLRSSRRAAITRS